MSAATQAVDLSFIGAIRAREQAATPGPWRWRGNTDTGDPYLAGGYHRDADGKPAGRAQDVLGHIPHEITRDEARRSGIGDWNGLHIPDIDRLPLDTYDDRWEAAMAAASEAAIDEYLTDPYGEPVKEPRMAFCTDYMYTQARDLAIYEVAPSATSRADKRIYRADITGIRHPDAEFIAHAREDIRALLAIIDALTGATP